MSRLLDMLYPFRENMRIFAERYNDFNDILKIVNTVRFGGDEITQEEYYRAARDQNPNLSPEQAEGVKNNFIDICRTLAASENDIGSIKNVIQLMDQNDFILDGITDVEAAQYANYRHDFEATWWGHLGDTLGAIESFLSRKDEIGVFKAIGDLVGPVQKGIDTYNAFISFLERVADPDERAGEQSAAVAAGAERVVGGGAAAPAAAAASGLYIRKHSHKPRRRRSKRSTRTKCKRKKERKRRSTRGKQKRSNKKRTHRKKNDRYY